MELLGCLAKPYSTQRIASEKAGKDNEKQNLMPACRSVEEGLEWNRKLTFADSKGYAIEN